MNRHHGEKTNKFLNNSEVTSKNRNEKRRKPAKPAKSVQCHVPHPNVPSNKFDDILAKAISMNQLTQSAIHAFPGKN